MKEKNSKALIVIDKKLGISRIIRFFYFGIYNWNYSSLKISEKTDYTFSNNIIVDRDSTHKIKVDNLLKNHEIIICMWNGHFDFQLDKIQIFVSLLKKKNIKHSFYLIGNNPIYEKKENFIYADEKIYFNKDVKIECNIKYSFIFYFSYIYYLLNIFKNPRKFFYYFFCKKLIFIGGGLLERKMISELINEKSHNSVGLVLNLFYNKFNQSKKKSITNYSLLLEIINSKIFNTLKEYEKFYTLQRIFRHLFFSELKSFKNFLYIPREHNIGLVRSNIFKNNYFLHLNSTLGYGIYDRTLQLYKHHKLNTVNIFFTKKNQTISNSIIDFQKILIELNKNKNKSISGYSIYKILKDLHI